MASILFPREKERRIIGRELKNLITYDGLDECEDNERASNFLIQYIDELESRAEGELMDITFCKEIVLTHLAQLVSLFEF